MHHEAIPKGNARRPWHHWVSWVILILGYIMFLAWSLQSSEEYNSGDKRTRFLLKDSYIPNRKMDLSDIQWRKWRWNFPLLFAALSLFVVGGRLLQSVVSKEKLKSSTILFYNLVNFGFLVYFHQWAVLIVYAVGSINYVIAHRLPLRWVPTVTWVFNLGVLVSAEVLQGYQFGAISSSLAFMDSHRGVLQWQVYFKITMLRQISHNLDFYWMASNHPVRDLSNSSEYSRRVETPLPRHDYNILNYFAYLYYVPLYIAGPITTFNAFVSYVGDRQTTIPVSKAMRMLAMVFVYTLGLEVALHYFYYVSLNLTGGWRELPAWEIAWGGYFTLNFMYTKFMVIWRFFRTIALLDGQFVLENMARCVNNNFTFTGFWRSWHASFNRWTVRYLYVPLGGKATQAYSIWLIFFFIGLWHDLWVVWIAWALMNCLFFSGELMVLKYFSSNKFSYHHQQWYWRYIVSFAGGVNIIFLMIANLSILHGFANGAEFVSRAFLSSEGVVVAIVAFLWLSSACSVMLQLRENVSKEIADT